MFTRITSRAAAFHPRCPGTLRQSLGAARRATSMASSPGLGVGTGELHDKATTGAPSPHDGHRRAVDGAPSIAAEGIAKQGDVTPKQRDILPSDIDLAFAHQQEAQEPDIPPKIPSSRIDPTDNDDPHRRAQMELLSVSDGGIAGGAGKIEEVATTPLFSQAVKVAAADPKTLGRSVTFPQYGLIGGLLAGSSNPYDPRLFLNTDAPWSAFICGSQGSGKSHTLSCILENSLVSLPTLGALPKPLAALVFHYDVVRKVLRKTAVTSKDKRKLDFERFKKLIGSEPLSAMQRDFLKLRLDLLESFIDRSEAERPGAWDFQPGTLTIVDLSCPFVDEKTACMMFDVCLSVFLEQNSKVGKMVVLDEAHKFMSQSSSANRLTQSLLSVIRLQRHLATRVVIATQEPTISPKILDLCSMAIVHRFTSPQWLQAISSHLAGAAVTDDDLETRRLKRIFQRIVGLNVGEALLFSPSAITSVAEESYDETGVRKKGRFLERLGVGYLKMRVRKRLTTDGGRSIMAADNENTN
ncbi:hypothetical protein GP486_003854 [Trichoglossum hirsutum]|uniref:P-loop containing nucleoside triphosphate hydrolase protein n=1 Tax=Trichoglossum hirsutum TaxID=265104 RepID=A0A9P8RQ24_9PEZI|nr:hypothetical protein GP486_003854 [Trichoglossum hirsutum]